VSLDFSVTCSFRPYHGPGVDSSPSENEYQEHFLGVKAASAWGWRPHHLHVLNVMKSGSLNLLEPSGPQTGPVTGLLYLIILYYSYERTCNIEMEMYFFNRGSSPLPIFLGSLNQQTWIGETCSMNGWHENTIFNLETSSSYLRFLIVKVGRLYWSRSWRLGREVSWVRLARVIKAVSFLFPR